MLAAKRRLHDIKYEIKPSELEVETVPGAEKGSVGKTNMSDDEDAALNEPTQRFEVACCNANHEGEWHGAWEECEVIADHGATCDVRIVEDGEVCSGVPIHLVRAMLATSPAAAPAGSLATPLLSGRHRRRSVPLSFTQKRLTKTEMVIECLKLRPHEAVSLATLHSYLQEGLAHTLR